MRGGGEFSSGDSLVSDSPVDATLDTGAPPPAFIPDPLVGMAAAVPMVVGAEAAPSVVGQEGAMAAEQGVDYPVPLLTSSTSAMQTSLANGYGECASEVCPLSFLTLMIENMFV